MSVLLKIFDYFAEYFPIFGCLCELMVMEAICCDFMFYWIVMTSFAHNFRQ